MAKLPPPEVLKLIEKFVDDLGALGLTVTASASAEPKPSDLATMGIRPAGSNADQALVNARLGYNAQADRRLWKPEDMHARIATWEKTKDKVLAAGVPADMGEYAVLTGLFSEFNGIESFNDPTSYIAPNFGGLSLHDKLLSDLTQPGGPSGGKKK